MAFWICLVQNLSPSRFGLVILEVQPLAELRSVLTSISHYLRWYYSHIFQRWKTKCCSNNGSFGTNKIGLSQNAYDRARLQIRGDVWKMSEFPCGRFRRNKAISLHQWRVQQLYLCPCPTLLAEQKVSNWGIPQSICRKCRYLRGHPGVWVVYFYLW